MFRVSQGGSIRIGSVLILRQYNAIVMPENINNRRFRCSTLVICPDQDKFFLAF